MKLARNAHSLSHYRLATLDMGYLVPVGLVEVLPGDKFIHSSRVLLRVQPLLKPVMHPVSVRVHHWFVPNRIIWDEWDDFITRSNPDLTIPIISLTAPGLGSLANHLGIPCDGSTNFDVNELPFRAYNKIWNHAYRDQDIDAPVAEDSTVLQRVRWEKDYFTTCRAEPQQGSVAIDIPFSAGLAPVAGLGVLSSDSPSTGVGQNIKESVSGNDYTSANTDGDRYFRAPDGLDGNDDFFLREGGGARGGTAGRPWVYADLSNATGGIDVNDLRASIAMQRFLEHRNRYGSRIEDYQRFLGIRPDDGRIQEPEYLGGGRNTISFSEVLANADSGNFSVGDLAGHGISALSTRKYRRFFKESGFVVSLLSIRPRTLYSNMLHKMWQRFTTFDYFQKELEAMGPQAVYVKELYGKHADAFEILGYNGRHDEYRHHPSIVTGQFGDGGSEEDWHFARDFTSAPALNSTLLECVPTDRVYADTATPEIYANVSHNLTAVRMVSKRARH